MSQTGTATASIDRELLDSYLVELVRVALAAGYTPSTFASGIADSVADTADPDSVAADLAAHIADTSAAHAASAISSTATGDVAATDVQGAIAELASEKAPKAAPTFTGVSTFPAGSFIDASGNINCQGAFSGQTAYTDIVGGTDANHPVKFRASTLTLNVNGNTTEKVIPQCGGHATAAPGVTDDVTFGWRKYDFWLKEDTHKVYFCEDPTDGAAVWTLLN